MFERMMEILDLVLEANSAEEKAKLWAEYDRLYELKYGN